MKTKETSTLYTTMSNNIGQVKKENAQKEIERLNKQDNTKSWRIDESTFMFVEDETDVDVHNPCELIEGYVWVTCEPKVQSTRELAIKWWDSLSVWGNPSKEYYIGLYYSDDTVTPERIEEIWKKQIQVKELSNAYHNAEYLKPNQKQFKQFDESLFKAYIDKFSDEDKVKMFEVLFKESKKWDGVNNAAPFYMSICRAYNAGKQSILNQKSAQDKGENPEKFFVSSNTYFKKEFGFE